MNRPQSTDAPPAGDPGDGGSSVVGTTSRSRSWLWPTAGLIGVLIVVVAIGRLGQDSPGPAPSTPAVATKTALPIVVPGRSLTIVRRPTGASANSQIGQPIGVRFDGDHYDDGIPSVLDGNFVARVRDAATLAADDAVLVGGWAHKIPCADAASGPGTCPLELSDSPYQSAHAASLMLGGRAAFDRSEGPRVFLATIESDTECLTSDAACLPRLNVGDALWSGDSSTSAAPYDPASLLAALSVSFPTIDLQPFEEATSCPVRWPIQSYVASAPNVPRAQLPNLPIRLVVIYGSPADLAGDAAASRAAAAAMTPFDASNRCVSIPGGVDDTAWVVRDNVMVLLGPEDAGVRGQVNTVLDSAVPVD